MQIKSADDKSGDIAELEAYLARPDLDPRTRRDLRDEIRTIQAGQSGERAAAYEIELNLGRSRNFMTIHDLRFVVDGFAAQIDHLILNRLGEIWVCESKHFAEGVSINDRREWFRYWKGKPIPIESPTEQNRRHIVLLGRLFDDGRVPLPRRLGLAKMRPDLRSLILVSNNAFVRGPRKAVPELSQVVKVERLEATVRGAIDASSPLRMTRVMGEEGLETFARDLAAIHQPITFNWAAKFRITSEAPTRQEGQTAAPSPGLAEVERPHRRGSGHKCAECGAAVSFAVVKFCWNSGDRFGRRILCMPCQAKVTPKGRT